MNDDTLQDESLFDRLVDNELAPDERRRLLASLDDRPGGWRTCALAFVEAQSWKIDLHTIVRTANVAPPVACASAPPSAQAARGLRLWALAACVLVAFTLGLAMREDGLSLRRAAPNPGEQIAESDVPMTTSAPAAAIAANKTAEYGKGDIVTLWVRDESGERRAVRVPLVDAEALDRELGLKFQPGLNDVARDQLKQHGYHVQSKQRYAPLWLENGRPMVVPVEDTRIVPVNEMVY